MPEYDDDLLTMPVSQLRNVAMTDPDDQEIVMGEHLNPLQFCTASSTDYTNFMPNGGGACVYPANSNSGMVIFISKLFEPNLSALKSLLMFLPMYGQRNVA